MQSAGQQKSEERIRIFSRRLRARVGRLYIQQNEIARVLGIEPGAVGNWMRGENLAKGRNLRKLAKLLEVSPEWLFGEGPEEPEILRELAPESEAELWRRRAKEAERRLEFVRSGLRDLLEETGPAAVNSVEPGVKVIAEGIAEDVRQNARKGKPE